jgi:enamine deaminase RidA (YjgF/YER057c/UK114 family)
MRKMKRGGLGFWVRFWMRATTFALMGLLLAISASAQPEPKMRKKKKNEDKEPVTQTLPLLPEPPLTVVAETERLTFQVSPLSNKGLLTQQSRDALKALMQANHGAPIVRLRAFVAGSGDMRRVQQIVSEAFFEKKFALPALTTVQVGALPLVGAQIVMEAVSEDKRVQNPEGLVFYPGTRAPDIQAAIAQLRSAVESSGVRPAGMLNVTCLAASLDDQEAAHAALSAAFPGAALNLMEAQRLPADRSASCEGAGRMEQAKPLPPSAKAAVVHTPKIVFSGIQMAFGHDDADLRLAFERLNKALSSLIPQGGILAARFYIMDRSLDSKLPRLAGELFHRDAVAWATYEIEGLPSLDASFGMDVIAQGN